MEADIVVIVVSEGWCSECEGNGDKQGFHIVGFLQIGGMIAAICPRSPKGISWRSVRVFGFAAIERLLDGRIKRVGGDDADAVVFEVIRLGVTVVFDRKRICNFS